MIIALISGISRLVLYGMRHCTNIWNHIQVVSTIMKVIKPNYYNLECMQFMWIRMIIVLSLITWFPCPCSFGALGRQNIWNMCGASFCCFYRIHMYKAQQWKRYTFSPNPKNTQTFTEQLTHFFDELCPTPGTALSVPCTQEMSIRGEKSEHRTIVSWNN